MSMAWPTRQSPRLPRRTRPQADAEVVVSACGRCPEVGFEAGRHQSSSRVRGRGGRSVVGEVAGEHVGRRVLALDGEVGVVRLTSPRHGDVEVRADIGDGVDDGDGLVDRTALRAHRRDGVCQFDVIAQICTGEGDSAGHPTRRDREVVVDRSDGPDVAVRTISCRSVSIVRSFRRVAISSPTCNRTPFGNTRESSPAISPARDRRCCAAWSSRSTGLRSTTPSTTSTRRPGGAAPCGHGGSFDLLDRPAMQPALTLVGVRDRWVTATGVGGKRCVPSRW